MTTMEIIYTISLPVLTGLILWYIKRRFDKNDEREEARTKFLFLVLKSNIAAIALGEVTATCIKNGKINGELDEAKKFATEAKNEIRDFAAEQGIKTLM